MQEKTGNQWQFLVLLFTFVSQISVAQKPIVALTSDKKEVGANEHVGFTVTSNVEGSMKIDFPVEFEVDLNVMHGMEQKMDPSGKIKTYYYMQQTGAFKKEGTYSFYAYTTYRNKTYRSNKITIKVNEASEEDDKVNSNDPVFGFIQCKKTTVYEGEPILLKAKVFSYINIEYLEGYSDFKADLSMEEHAFPNGRVEVEQTRVNGKDALAFEYGKQLLIPVGTGKCHIKPYEMALRCHGSLFSKTMRFRSSGLTINIKPLPGNAPKDFIGAVGEYRLSQKNPSKEVKEGDVFTLELIISGVGNLHNSNAPKLKLPKGCSIYGDPERVEDIEFTESGAEGTITYRFNIQVLEGHDLAFTAPSVSYFDPEKERYIAIKGNAFNINVIPDKSFNPVVLSDPASGTHTDMVDLKTQKTTTSATNTSTSSKSRLWVGIVAPTSLLGLLFLLLVVRKRKKKEVEKITVSETDDLVRKPVFLDDAKPETPAAAIDYWKDAENHLEDPGVFAILLPKAIIQRIEQCEKCNFQSREKAFDRLLDTKPEIAKGLREIIEICDQYRYGFGAEHLETRELLANAENLLKQLPS
ncbi:BatD family protein [Fluviicola sp.]|uniref:BatD family protein n=1 Tax=Fluviicola sp. TaxID=1917219 RepID=UPI0031DBD896